MKGFIYIAAGFIVVALASLVGFGVGLLAGEWGAKARRFSYEEHAIAPVLASDPAFAQLEIVMYTGDGSAYLMGEVPTDSDLQRLRSKMDDLLGKLREAKPLDGVSTATSSP